MGCFFDAEICIKEGNQRMSNSESNFRIMLQAILDKVKSIANIKGDIKAIEPSAALQI